MRLSMSLVILVCFMLALATAKPSLQERLPPTTSSQKYVLLKPLSAALSYIYYATSRSTDTIPTMHTPINYQDSGSDPIHHKGPVAALSLVLFFCVLTF
ncbi:hypothetical protein [Absidia glauca]|uniref:Uncharacterized protein n=1 Tax=Absidia glauca TaxID=4829 RepID=A0A163JIT5_ABSGL|nr:hypothetical protein [Absidia glauca]